MSTRLDTQLGEQTQATSTTEIDPLKLQYFMQQVRENQNLLLGLVGGIGAAVIGAIIWAVITAVTKHQIGWMAVGVGFLVGIAVRQFGKGIDKVFGIAGAGLSLMGCLAGNLLAVALVVSQTEAIPLLDVVFLLLTSPILALEVIRDTFSPIDLLFYGLAIYEGYRFSFRQLNEAEVRSLLRYSALHSETVPMNR